MVGSELGVEDSVGETDEEVWIFVVISDVLEEESRLVGTRVVVVASGAGVVVVFVEAELEEASRVVEITVVTSNDANNGNEGVVELGAVHGSVTGLSVYVRL